jgi:signal transduction histidine kinase
VRDITERRRAEEELRTYQGRLEELVEERTTELKQEIAERKAIEDRFKKLNEDLEERVRERTREMERAYEELKKLDEMKDAFLSSVSHELRTPLTSIRSFSEILLRYEPDDPDTRTEFIDIINSESERLTRLINDLLDLARIEAGEMVWNDHHLSVQSVVNDVAKAHRQLLEDRALRLTQDVPHNLPSVLADRDRIHQVLTNLLGNAIKFSFDGGEIRIKAEVVEHDPSGNNSETLLVSLSDQGIGIEEQDFEAIFDRFRQVSKDSLREKPRGTGLGLPITREIITRYGGQLWVESHKGEGSTFFFTLPVAAPMVQPTHPRSLPAEKMPA